MQTQMHEIVIVGGGAGGLELATKLGKQLGKRKRANITLVDCSLTHLWKPLWHEVAAGTLLSHEDELNYIAHAYQHHFNFEFGRLDDLERLHKRIFLSPVVDEHNNEIIPRRTLHYDTLIIAIGSESNDFGTPGVREHCAFLDDRLQSEEFQQQLLKKILHSQNQLHVHGFTQLTIAIVGGGATGVELAAELHYAIRQAARYSRTQVNSNYQIKISVIEASDRLLAALPSKVSENTQKQLEKMGIEVYTGQRVLEVNDKGLLTQTGLFIAADLKVWAAGIKASNILAHLDDLEVNHLNQLKVKSTLQTTIDDNIFAFGDCASCPRFNGSELTVPPRAQAAHQQAMLLVKSMKYRLNNKPLPLYRYRDYGSLVTLSRQHTVGNLMGALRGTLFIEGTIARLVYLSLYKKHQMVLHGFWRVFLMTLAELIGHRVKPKLKLH
jgi:NADH dehydrogenase